MVSMKKRNKKRINVDIGIWCDSKFTLYGYLNARKITMTLHTKFYNEFGLESAKPTKSRPNKYFSLDSALLALGFTYLTFL